ncbi:MAG: energy-coupling factor transporter ATPase [Clostridiales bacterium]|nr:energy-coupling factor transporter ATPase [Clostridiales bacterium]
MQIISVENVSYSYDKQNMAIKNVSFSVQRGEYVSIIGHNGSGKSTIARLLNALIKPDEGEVTVDGLSSLDKKNLFEIRKRVGVVFQNPDNQLVASIVEDDVAFGPENLGVPREEIGERIEFALSAVGMTEFRKSSPVRLSGGQKQRIAIAGVLALKPDVLVLDESTAMLDPRGRKEVLDVVEKLNKEQGVTVISITHYMEETVRADRVLVMDGGELILQGCPQEIFAKKDVLTAIGLEIPPAMRIAEKLVARGVPLPSGILTEERLGEELCKL